MATKDSTLTQDQVKSLFDYKDGCLYWKNKTTNLSRAKIGCAAGSLSSSKYLLVGINNKTYLVHRVIFLLNNGYMPKFVDHIDGNKLNNKIENLREVSNGQNRMNSKLQVNNKSNIKNVNWHKKQQKWVVQLGVEGKKLYFGAYFDLNVAKFVAETMRHKHHKQFARSI
jgi:hypothetical protein